MPLTFLRYKVDAENRELTYAFANVYLCTVGDEEKFSTLAMPVRERNDAHVLRSYKHFLDLKKASDIGARVAREALELKMMELHTCDLVRRGAPCS